MFKLNYSDGSFNVFNSGCFYLAKLKNLKFIELGNLRII